MMFRFVIMQLCKTSVLSLFGTNIGKLSSNFAVNTFLTKAHGHILQTYNQPIDERQ